MRLFKIGGVEFEYIDVREREEKYNGEDRRTLTVYCMPGVIGMDVLNAMLTEQNLASITLENTDTGAVAIHEGYVLKLACGIHSEKIQDETPNSPALYEDRLVFKIGRRTYIEQKLHELGL